MADFLNTTNLSRRSILDTGIAAAGALVVGAVPATALASGSAEAAAAQSEFHNAVRKMLTVLGKAESERRITYLSYGKYTAKRVRGRKGVNSGRFVIDLKGEDHLYFLMAIMVGCVLSGHRTVADFELVTRDV